MLSGTNTSLSVVTRVAAWWMRWKRERKTLDRLVFVREERLKDPQLIIG